MKVQVRHSKTATTKEVNKVYNCNNLLQLIYRLYLVMKTKPDAVFIFNDSNKV